MSDAPTDTTRNGNLIGVIGVLVLLLGTATGDAYVIFGLSLAGFCFISGYYCGALGSRTPLMVLVVGLAAALIAALVVALL